MNRLAPAPGAPQTTRRTWAARLAELASLAPPLSASQLERLTRLIKPPETRKKTA